MAVDPEGDRGVSERAADNDHTLGDKVRVRRGPSVGERGRVLSSDGESVEVELQNGDRVFLASGDITNYSRAARRAWRTMPKRAGRPRGEGEKRMVSLRLDSRVWQSLAAAAEMGLIASREQAVNEWLREKAEALVGLGTSEPVGAPQSSRPVEYPAPKSSSGAGDPASVRGADAEPVPQVGRSAPMTTRTLRSA